MIEKLRARVESLERQLAEANTRDRENRRLLAAALERVPELGGSESPERSEEGNRSPTEPPGGATDGRGGRRGASEGHTTPLLVASHPRG